VKKAVVILLLVLYSASTIGATINMHYCMNKFAGFSFKEVKKDKCPKCGMKNTGCCKDEKKQIKLTLDQQKAAYQASFIFQPIVLANSFQISATPLVATFQKQGWISTHAPPLLSHINVQAYFSNFLI
jgi:hypothetical protein